MAPKLLAKPFAATIRERLRAKPSALKSHRIAPPTAQQIASVHRLPVPAVQEVRQAETMAKKTKIGRFADDYKAKIVARALQGKESGAESVEDIANAEGIWSTNIHNWIKAAKKANGTPAETEASKKPKKDDIKSLSRELVEAMERVTSIKKKMRKLLGEE